MFCPSCGTQNSDGGLFCEKCGASLKDAKFAGKEEGLPNTPRLTVPVQKKKRINPIVIVAVFIICVLAIILINKGGAKSNPLIGTWSDAFVITKLTFEKGGNFTGKFMESEILNGKYSIKKDTLKLTYDLPTYEGADNQVNVSYTYKITAGGETKTLDLSGDYGSMQLFAVDTDNSKEKSSEAINQDSNADVSKDSEGSSDADASEDSEGVSDADASEDSEGGSDADAGEDASDSQSEDNSSSEVVDDPNSFFSVKNGVLVEYIGNDNILHISGDLGITEIPADIFTNNMNLKSVTVPEGVKVIGNYAFSGCVNLKTVILPDGVTKIGRNAFEQCISLEEIKLPDGISEIGASAFSNCTTLTSIDIPQSITSIPENTFINCTNLVEVSVPKGLVEFGNSAFEYCTSLKEIVIPDGVTVLNPRVFSDCTRLESVILSKNLTDIGYRSFSYCAALKKINLPEGLFRIDNQAFLACTSLTSIETPKSVVKIGAVVFADCDSLAKAVIHGSPEIIIDCFNGCTNLKEIHGAKGSDTQRCAAKMNVEFMELKE